VIDRTRIKRERERENETEEGGRRKERGRERERERKKQKERNRKRRRWQQEEYATTGSLRCTFWHSAHIRARASTSALETVYSSLITLGGGEGRGVNKAILHLKSASGSSVTMNPLGAPLFIEREIGIIVRVRVFQTLLYSCNR
jgi:hypothetical protein